MKLDLIYVCIRKPSEPNVPHDFHSVHLRFAQTYRKFKPEIPHRLIIACYNGERDAETEKLFLGLNAEYTYYTGHGFDMGCFQGVMSALDSDFVVGCNTQIHFHRYGWLERMADAFEKHGEGLYGPMASYENSPHIRGVCMAMPPKLMRRFPHPIDCRRNSYRAESGETNFTQWVLSQNKPALMVTWDEVLAQPDWRKPDNIFRRGDQSNCIVWDRHTKVWEEAAEPRKSELQRAADGKNNARPASFFAGIQRKKTITVVAVTSLAPKSHAKAIDLTVARVPHHCERLLISPKHVDGFTGKQCPLPADWSSNGKWTIQDMCGFLLFGLHEYIQTDIAILVQWDGYAHSNNWDERFLSFDYIGAPWPKRFPFVRGRPRGRVGNGGFSLRSKRWLEASAKLPKPAAKWSASEDVYSNTLNYDHFAKAGCKVAPLDVAIRWSLEHTVEEYPRWKISESFGFHGLTDKDPQRAHLRLNPHD